MPPSINLGIVLSAQGKFVEAEQLYRRVVAIDPGMEKAHTNLGSMSAERVQWRGLWPAVDTLLAEVGGGT